MRCGWKVWSTGCGLCDEMEEMDGRLRIHIFANWLLVVCEIESVNLVRVGECEFEALRNEFSHIWEIQRCGDWF